MAVSGRAMITLLLVCGLLNCSAATVYNVGGDAGWTLLTSANSPSYDSQFTGISLHPGDGLNFTFAEGAHNVWTSDPANVCNATFGAFLANQSVTIYPSTDATSSSISYFCGFPNHCSEYGMHLTVTVEGSSAAAPDSSPTASPSPPPMLEGA